VGCAYVLLMAAWLVPDLGESAPARGAAWLAFMVRTFTFHEGLAAAGLLGYCLVLRHRRAALALLPILGFALGPAAASMLPRRAGTPHGTTLTILSANLLYSNADATPFVRLVRNEAPDVIVIQEYSPAHHRALTAELSADYPHRVHAMRDDAFGMAVYSRHPFVGTPTLYPPAALSEGGRRGGVVNLSDPQVRAVIDVGGREVVVQGVHAMPPVSADHLAEQTRLVEWVAQFAAGERRPLVVCGDLNATPESASLRRLRRAGLVDAHAAAGRGRGCTWPALGPLRFVPGIRIDHVLTKGGLRCTELRVGPEVGSDHLPIVARVSLDAPAGP
jgi:endonuclease/exonuclease/phosphatase (EEP) superfamily protein YafD